MSLLIPALLAKSTDYEPLANKASRYGDEVKIQTFEMTDEMLEAIHEAAIKVGENSTARTTAAIIAARKGDNKKKIPRLAAAPEMMLGYFRANLHDGWLYQRKPDGHLHAWLVVDVKHHLARNPGDQPHVTLSMVANSAASGASRNGRIDGLTTHAITLHAERVTHKTVSDILTAQGLYIETPDLRAEYDAGLRHYETVLVEGFSEQYRYSGTPLSSEGDRYRTPNARTGRKVVHDLAPSEVNAPATVAPSEIFQPPGGDKVTEAQRRNDMLDDGGETDWGVGPVPIQFLVRVFDLATHDFLWVNAIDMVRYEYDKTLGEKIVLPEDQRNLLNILTSDLADFTGDVIEGKSAGNVVLCKGAPGVGKTLTAEIYSELIERPLYSIHSGNLGTSAEAVRQNLEVSFGRAQRWNAVLLLDEADVFVLERGDNIQQNAIVAEFLRTLEYFTGLMFMTTNRADNIDDAILSRAAAIIDYAIPGKAGIREVWKVLATNYGTQIEESLLDDLVNGFVHITPRDVKMLLRLALRVAKAEDSPLTADIVARCAMFRGLHYAKGSRV